MRKILILVLLFIVTLSLISCDKTSLAVKGVNTEEIKDNNLIKIYYEDFQEVDLQKDDLKLYVDGKRVNEVLPIYIR